MRFPALLIACLFLLTAMSGCLDNTNDNGDDDDEPKGPAYIRLSDPRPLGSPSYGSWDIEVTVTSVTPEGIEAPWSDYSIKSGPKSGTSKDHWTIQPYTGETNWSGKYYKKTIGNSPYVEEGDVILVTGVSASATEGSIFMLDSFNLTNSARTVELPPFFMELEVFNVTPREIAGGDVVWDVYVWITDLEPSRTTAFMSDFDLYVEKADGNGTDPNLNARDYKTPENRTLEMEFLYKWRIERWEVYRCDFWVISSLTTEYEGGLCRLMFDYYSWWCVGQVDLPDSFEDFEDD